MKPAMTKHFHTRECSLRANIQQLKNNDERMKKGKYPLHYALMLCMLFLLSSCSKNEKPVQPESVKGNELSVNGRPGKRSGADVYIAGALGLNQFNPSVVKYWKNGTVTSLTTSAAGNKATGIAVLGNDVYVCGSQGYVAKYWKYGVAHTLPTSGGVSSYAEGIAISGNDVYVCGENLVQDSLGRQFSILKCWKNGVEIFSSGTTGNNGFDTYANGIAVSNGNVYILGMEENGGQIQTIKYWKNGVPTTVREYIDGRSPQYVIAYGIAAIGNDAYVVGAEGVGLDGGFTRCWKNGTLISLPGAGYIRDQSYSVQTAITASGNDIYVAGTGIDSTGNVVLKYWKNASNPVTVTTDAVNSTIRGIAVSGCDVYIAGKTGSQPLYWKNGVSTLFGNTGDEPRAITVK
jgi:hypothetical protein